VTYRRLATPLHATRALVGAAYALALATAALLSDSPIVLAAIGGAVLGAAALAQVAGPVLRAARWSLLLALLIALLNPLLDRNGLTVLVRFGHLPPLGQVDITLEAVVYGAVLGLRVLVVVAAASLFTLTVDPDALLRAMRRVSFRSALTAVLATRLVPVLVADGHRLAEAQRCRADGGGSRLALVRAVATGALDRAVEVAATLEVRGYAIAGRPARARDPWSRHDVAFLASALVVVALAVVGSTTGTIGATYYPELHVDADPATLLFAGALVVAALAPFADRRGVGA
jgi:energy-coupling factor transport system permease protein